MTVSVVHDDQCSSSVCQKYYDISVVAETGRILSTYRGPSIAQVNSEGPLGQKAQESVNLHMAAIYMLLSKLMVYVGSPILGR